MWKTLILISSYFFLCKKFSDHKKLLIKIRKINETSFDNKFKIYDEYFNLVDYDNYYRVPL